MSCNVEFDTPPLRILSEGHASSNDQPKELYPSADNEQQQDPSSTTSQHIDIPSDPEHLPECPAALNEGDKSEHVLTCVAEIPSKIVVPLGEAIPIVLGTGGNSAELAQPGITTEDHGQVKIPVQMSEVENPSITVPAADDQSTTTTGPSASILPSAHQESVYHIKWVKWKEKKISIITQNENGPCPLIAIMNILILKGKVVLPSMVEMITAGQLMEYLGECILEYIPKNISEGVQLNYEQNVSDAMTILPKLQTGLDVNVRFTGVSDFEYTAECIIFDLLNIPLYHGWLLDPQMSDVVAAVGNASYNQLVERVITEKASPDSDVVTNALIAETFLERTASQLTYHGLCELNAAIQENELGVLFRNNHFSTVYKHKEELFQLVTDQGFLTESNVVWETLSNIDGAGQFVDGSFMTVPPKCGPGIATSNPEPSEQQIDQDYLVALSLQDEQQRLEERESAWNEFKEKQLGVSDHISDEELARRLQQQEQDDGSELAAARSRPPQPSPSSSTPSECRRSEGGASGKKSRDCTIL